MKQYEIEMIKEEEEILCILKLFRPYFMDSIRETTEELGDYAEKLAQRAEFIAAKSQGSTEAFMVYYINDHKSKTAYITLLAVKPDYRKKGIAGALAVMQLVEYAREKARLAGMKWGRLEVNKKNTHAIGLYEKLGFWYSGEASGESVYMMCHLCL